MLTFSVGQDVIELLIFQRHDKATLDDQTRYRIVDMFDYFVVIVDCSDHFIELEHYIHLPIRLGICPCWCGGSHSSAVSTAPPAINQSISKWVSEWVNEWVSEWMNEWMNKWMEYMNEWMN